MKQQQADVAVVGGGIAGLAFALAHSRAGRRVVLFERDRRALGASIRNFGLIWPIGQRTGPARQRALRSRELWLELAREAGFWIHPNGSVHLAHHPDEMALLEEFCDSEERTAGRCLLSPAGVRERSPAAQTRGLLGGLWSPTEGTVDPRQAIPSIAAWLARARNVTFRYGAAVTGISLPHIETASETWQVQEAWVCSGAEFEILFPELFAGSGLTKCKLQMMRTGPQPDHWTLGPTLCGGLTLAHYASFSHCPSRPQLVQRLAEEFPFLVKHGIHVLLAQTADRSLMIGDSHEYGPAPDPFDREEINQAILQHLESLAILPLATIQERWHGVYARVEGKTEFLAEPSPGVHVVTGLAGSGMTLSFGLAEELVERHPGR